MASIDEGIFLHGVAMEVAEERDLSELLDAHDHFFEVEYLRVVYFGGVGPFAIEVVPRYVGPVVPMNDPIRVEHRYYFEDEVLSQPLGLFVVGDQELDDSVADI